MNWDRIQGNWKQVAGKSRTRWGKRERTDESTASAKSEWLAGKRRAKPNTGSEPIEGESQEVT